MRRISMVAAAAAVLVAATGCVGGSNNAGAQPTVTTTVTATATVTATPTVPTPAHPARMGQQVVGKYVAATVLQVDPNTPIDPGVKGQARWYSVLVKVCGMVDRDDKGKPVVVSWAPWNVADSDGARFDVTGWTGGIAYPIQTYPQDTGARLVKGQCIKGWITFNIAPKAKISRVVYSGAGGDPVVWQIPARG